MDEEEFSQCSLPMTATLSAAWHVSFLLHFMAVFSSLHVILVIKAVGNSGSYYALPFFYRFLAIDSVIDTQNISGMPAACPTNSLGLLLCWRYSSFMD